MSQKNSVLSTANLTMYFLFLIVHNNIIYIHSLLDDADQLLAA